MQKRIFLSIFGMCSLWGPIVFIAGIMILKDYYERQVFVNLQQNIQYIKQGLKHNGLKYLHSLYLQQRITLINGDGLVIFDNYENKTRSNENYLNREEINNSIKNGFGKSIRYSKTLDEYMIYYASKIYFNDNEMANIISESKNHKIPNKDNWLILRLANPQSDILDLIYTKIPYFLLGMLIFIIINYFLAKKLAKNIILPINSINLEKPLESKTYTELSPLLNKLYNQNKTIQMQIKNLKTKQDEFNAITQNMEDGFLLVDYLGNIISFNKSSTKVFGSLREGMSVFGLQEDFLELFSLSLNGDKIQKMKELDDRNYKIIFQPVFDSKYNYKSDESPIGLAVIILDLTEKIQRESLRKEFSANASHELKTPITSILGIVEMIKNNLIKPNDMPKFIDKIYNETKRLTTLIEDIIKLSQLDEETIIKKYPVKIKNICKIVEQRLKEYAEQKNISISIEGEDFEIMGVSDLLETMVFNLCNNSIKYNKSGGNVTMILNNIEKVLCVKDNGIGIPKIYHDRVFERFFCVDKSHSKDIGGTGLGLSIVKNTAKFHNATIKLSSKENVGTSISIYF